MIVNLPFTFSSHNLTEINVKNYIELYKASNRSNEEFIFTINRILNSEYDIFSLILILLKWRELCISDKPFPFGEKRETPPENIFKQIKENYDKIVENYPKGITLPYFHKWNDIGNDIVSFSSSEDLSGYPANILTEHLKWCNSNYCKNTRYSINLTKNIMLWPDKELLFQLYKSILLPYDISYIQDLLAFLGKNYNFDGFYWESKTIIELEYFHTKVINHESTN
jgi:hypothetical protein